MAVPDRQMRQLALPSSGQVKVESRGFHVCRLTEAAKLKAELGTLFDVACV